MSKPSSMFLSGKITIASHLIYFCFSLSPTNLLTAPRLMVSCSWSVCGLTGVLSDTKAHKPGLLQKAASISWDPLTICFHCHILYLITTEICFTFEIFYSHRPLSIYGLCPINISVDTSAPVVSQLYHFLKIYQLLWIHSLSYPVLTQDPAL